MYVYMTHGLAATERMPFRTAVTDPRTRALAEAGLDEVAPCYLNVDGRLAEREVVGREIIPAIAALPA